MGLAYLRLKQFDRALQCFEQVIQIDPNLAIGWYNKATYEALVDDRLSAIKSLEKAISLDPNLRLMAKDDPDFKNLRKFDEFHLLTR